MRHRITFSKASRLIYTSHLDLNRIWVRTLRRAGVPLVHSRGYNPRPKLQLAAALPLGHAGQAELLDIWVEKEIPADQVAGMVEPVLVDGLAVSSVHQVDEVQPALPTLVSAAEYAVTVEWEEPGHLVERRIERVLAAGELVHERRGRAYDLRPLIEDLSLERLSPAGLVLAMQLTAQEGATGRPEAVLDVLDMGGTYARFCRRRLILDLGGV